MINIFSLMNKEERKRATEFHSDCDKKPAGAIGGGKTYSFTPTSLGYVVQVTCDHCKVTENITDYDCW